MGNVVRYIFLLVIILFFLHPLAAFQDFKTLYKASDPASKNLSIEAKKEAHKLFLDSVQMRKDTMGIILGHFYLSNDHVIASQYEDAMTHLIHAEELASEIVDTLILGCISHKKGLVFSLIQNYQKGIEEYEKALIQNSIAKDSQFIAITLEQLGALHGYNHDFVKSTNYYHQAIPLVEKHCAPKSLATTLSNYGNTLIHQDKFSEAIDIYKRAIVISEQIDDLYRIIPAKQNLALAYLNVDSLSQALDLYVECKKVNEENSWLDFLVYSYEGLALTFEKMSIIDSSLTYFKKYDFLRDSLFGVNAQTRINSLVTEREMRQKEEEVRVKSNQVLFEQRKKYNLIIGAIIFILLSSIGFWLLANKNRDTEMKLKDSRSALVDLSNDHQSKNGELRTTESRMMYEVHNNGEKFSGLFGIDMYDMKILTDEDWNFFKVHFEKAYPNYIQKVRQRFPTITEAEERLFLFIKLNLTNKESANILGIKSDTIKKTRMRLRKRLKLKKGEDLDHLVRTF